MDQTAGNQGDTSKKGTNALQVYVRRHKKYDVVSDSADSTAVSDSSSSSHQIKSKSAASPLRREMTNDLFQHCFKNIWSGIPLEKREMFTYLDCLYFYMYTFNNYKDDVLTWIKDRNIFSKTYVLIPIVQWNHWYLLVLCNFGESLDSETKTPCMLLLDSLHALNPWKLEPLIRSFVMDIFRTEGRRESHDQIDRIPLLVPEVPQQRDNKECGVYALHFVNLFLESAPETFSITSCPYFMKEDWFDEDTIESFYKRLEEFGTDGFDD